MGSAFGFCSEEVVFVCLPTPLLALLSLSYSIGTLKRIDAQEVKEEGERLVTASRREGVSSGPASEQEFQSIESVKTFTSLMKWGRHKDLFVIVFLKPWRALGSSFFSLSLKVPFTGGEAASLEFSQSSNLTLDFQPSKGENESLSSLWSSVTTALADE